MKSGLTIIIAVVCAAVITPDIFVDASNLNRKGREAPNQILHAIAQYACTNARKERNLMPRSINPPDGGGGIDASIMDGIIVQKRNADDENTDEDRSDTQAIVVAVKMISKKKLEAIIEDAEQDEQDNSGGICPFLHTTYKDSNSLEIITCPPGAYTATAWMNVCDSSVLQTLEAHPDITGVRHTSSASTSSSSSSLSSSSLSSSTLSFETGRRNTRLLEPTERFTGSGTVKNQAIAALQVTELYERYPELLNPRKGDGQERMKIGIISNSYDHDLFSNTTEADDITTGNLPSEDDGNKVIVLNDNPVTSIGYDPNDEGRAMAQLIYDILPNVQMYFYTGFLPQGNFVEAIEKLVEVGCDVIVDDLRFFTDPIYQLGENAQAATKAAQQGVSYFTVAGNRDDLSYETIFKAMPCKCDQSPPPPTFAPTQILTDAPTKFLTQFPTGFPTQVVSTEPNKCFQLYEYPYVNCVDFGNGSDRQYFHIKQGGNYTLFWDEPWGSISGGNSPINDFDMYLWNAETGVRVSSAIEANAGISALEEIVIDNPGYYYWVIPLFQSVDDVTGMLEPPIPTNLRLKWIANAGSITDLDPGELDKPTLNHHGNAPLVASVAAASTQQAFGQLLHEPSTALGGIPLLFDTNGARYPVPLILERPQFTGPDAVYTTFFGERGYGLEQDQKSDTTPPRFFGTSASATNVAAVGILLRQACMLFGSEGNLETVSSNQHIKKRNLEAPNYNHHSMKKSTKKQSMKKSKKKQSKKDPPTPKPPTPKPKFQCLLPENIYKLMSETAIDMNHPGFDFRTGTGFVNALAAVEKLIELVNDDIDPSILQQWVSSEHLVYEEEQQSTYQCPIENFLFPISSFFDEPYELMN